MTHKRRKVKNFEPFQSEAEFHDFYERLEQEQETLLREAIKSLERTFSMKHQIKSDNGREVVVEFRTFADLAVIEVELHWRSSFGWDIHDIRIGEGCRTLWDFPRSSWTRATVERSLALTVQAKEMSKNTN